jgi:hypothetical protein
MEVSIVRQAMFLYQVRLFKTKGTFSGDTQSKSLANIVVLQDNITSLLTHMTDETLV